MPQITNADSPTLQNSVEQFDPGRIGNDLTNDQKIDDSIPQGNALIVNKPSSAISNSEAGKLKFMCHKIILKGNTVFSTAKISKLYQDSINKEISLAKLEQISQSITEYYRNAGYILSQAIIPPQKISDEGIATINIYEGYIDKVLITGCKNDSVYYLLNKYGMHIAQVNPITLEKLERFAFLANDIPGVKVRTVLNKSDQSSGAADLTFIVNEKSLGGSIAFNDYNSMVLGREQYIANIHVNNITLASETAINGVMGRYNGRMKFASFTHRQQLNTNGLGGRIALSHINTNPDMTKIGLDGFIIPGEATIATANLEYVWVRSHNKNLYIGGGIKYLNSKTVFGDTPLFNDNTRSANLYFSYNFLQGEKSYNLLSITYSQGFDAFGALADPPSRVGEHLNFSKFELYASNTYRISKTKFSTFIAIKGQYAFNIVPSSETFTYGGVPFGSGYDLAEFSGDRGIAGLLEVQYPSYAIERYKLFSMIFAFIDTGFVWDINTTVPPSNQSGTSAGAGHRITAIQHLNLDLIIAIPLKPYILNNNDNYVKLLFNIKLTV